MHLHEIVNSDPELMGGTPVFRGTRVPIQSLFDWLEVDTLEEFLENFPSVSREQVIELLRIAGKVTLDLAPKTGRAALAA